LQWKTQGKALQPTKNILAPDYTIRGFFMPLCEISHKISHKGKVVNNTLSINYIYLHTNEKRLCEEELLQH